MASTIDIQKFNHLEVSIDTEKILKKHRQKAAKKLRDHPASVPPIKERREEKEYFSTWRSKFDKGSHTAVVYNKGNGRLTYLLENGHFITNKIGGLGWARPHPHIEGVFREGIPDFVRDMENVDIKVDLK